MDNSEYLSREKLREIEAELEELKTAKRKELADRLEYAKSLGDLSENAEYKEAKEQQSLLEDKIARLEDIVRRAVIIKAHKGDKVRIGSSVRIRKAGTGEEKQYQIVGPEEVDILSGKISNLSPMGAALMGKKKGEVAEVETKKGKVKYEIIGVS